MIANIVTGNQNVILNHIDLLIDYGTIIERKKGLVHPFFNFFSPFYRLSNQSLATYSSICG